jgi:hypothetical protein
MSVRASTDCSPEWLTRREERLGVSGLSVPGPEEIGAVFEPNPAYLSSEATYPDEARFLSPAQLALWTALKVPAPFRVRYAHSLSLSLYLF